MTLLQLANGAVILYDCNVTDENRTRILGYLKKVLGSRGIDIFANSHRDADHMRGVRQIHNAFPIAKMWDSGVTGGTPDSTEYREYIGHQTPLAL